MTKFLLVSTLASLISSTALARPVTVKGSDTMVVLTQRWAEAYMKKNPGTTVQVTGGGSGVGISALLMGTTDIAASSRAIKPAEQAKLKARFKAGATETPVAKDGVTFFVNDKNPVGVLTMDQLRKIYLGDVKSWKEVGGPAHPIVLYSRENSSGTYAFVKEHLLKEEDFAAEAQTLPGTSAVVNAVSQELHGIGYGGAAFAKGIKELKVRTEQGDIPATPEEVKSGRYPLSRSLFFYTRGELRPEVKAFIDFCLSPEGQQLVSKVGYFPIK